MKTRQMQFNYWGNYFVKMEIIPKFAVQQLD